MSDSAQDSEEIGQRDDDSDIMGSSRDSKEEEDQCDDDQEISRGSEGEGESSSCSGTSSSEESSSDSEIYEPLSNEKRRRPERARSSVTNSGDVDSESDHVQS